MVACKGTGCGDTANENREKIGSPKVVLGAILAVYAENKVRPKLSTRDPSLTSLFPECLRCCVQGRDLLLRVVALEAHFDPCPSDVRAETSGRITVVRMYVTLSFH